MKSSLATVAFVAISCSVATVIAFETFRPVPLGVPPTLVTDARSLMPAAVPDRGNAALSPPARLHDEPTGLQIRLAELESRVASLEAKRPTAREPASPRVDDEQQRAELHSLVLGWIADERELRRQADQSRNEEERRTELEFSLGHQAYVLADQNNLNDWQEGVLFDVLLEIENRRMEVEQSVDLSTDTPESLEARWTKFDEWADQRLRDEFGEEWIDRMFGDD